MPTGRAYEMAMLRKRYVDEWIVEPDIPGSREYARLAIIAEPAGLNIDGQALIPWESLRHARASFTKEPTRRNATR